MSNLTGSYSLVRSINYSAKNDSAKYLPFLPAPRWLAQLKLTRKKVGDYLANAYLMVEAELYQAQNQVLLAYGTETPTPGYALINMGFGADIVNKDKITLFSIYVNGQNLLDEAYQSHQSRFKYLATNQATGRRGVYNMGRNISLKVVVPISIKR